MGKNYQVLGDKNSLVKAWVNGVYLEDKAKQQLLNVASLPFIHRHVAAMPDVHWGLGATVGSVIPTRKAIIPAAVGVDLGCLDADTEFLSPKGWVRIADWSGQKVLSYDPKTDTAHFCEPSDYVNLPCDEFFHFKNSRGMDQMVCADHRMLVFSGYKGRGYSYSVMRPSELVKLSLRSGYHSSKASFHVRNPELDISDDLIRIEVMVQADGRVRRTSLGNRVELHMRRDRKIERAKQLLTTASVDFTSNVESSGSTRIAFTLPFDVGNKDFSRYWTASERQLAIIADEVIHWDGRAGYRSNYSTTDVAARDLVQYAFTATGTRAGWSNSGKQEAHHNDVFLVTPTRNPMVGYCEPTMAPSPDGRKYCFVVDTGFFVARRNGKIFTTGNCGMSAVRTSLTANDLPDNLRGIRDAIEQAVPHGRTNNGGKGDRGAWGNLPGNVARIWEEELDYGYRQIANKHTKINRGNNANHLGTLGTGNHFIELCLDQKDRVWVMLHSGSRGVGNRIGSYFIELAKKDMERFFINLPDKNLAYFPQGTDHFDDYVKAVHWAQEFARLNREVMMDNVLNALLKCDQLPGQFVSHEAVVNCHHNYVQMENHFGANVWVTRKGAVSAKEGDLGIIPGSMGAKSYIVRGKGNPESFHSCSHGAGRMMSRSEARKRFTLEDHERATQGVECRKDADVIDETPAAYKDIDAVMKAQEDLVEVVHTLRQVVCVKG